jgi:thymidylate synthase (FAD)
MTKQSQIENNPKFIKVLDHGFVGLVDHMGSDKAIADAARVSYGEGTKSVSDDRVLIRYLLRHKHTTPFEHCELKFHIKCPLVIMTQILRHRMASPNVMSGRYSIMSDEFYIPSLIDMAPQSKDNKQGRAGEIPDNIKYLMQQNMEHVYRFAYDTYERLIGKHEDNDFDDFNLARELARMVLPYSNYSEMYWKIDLHNLFHFLKLRQDPHAQKEVRDIADAIYQLASPLFPIAFEAYFDYVKESVTLSRMEVQFLREVIDHYKRLYNDSFSDDITKDTESELIDLGMSKREVKEFKERWNL